MLIITALCDRSKSALEDPEKLEYSVEVISGSSISYLFDSESTILTATPPQDWNGDERISAKVKANLGGELSKEATLTVTAVNDKPFINKIIPNQHREEGVQQWSLNLTGYGSDPDLIYGEKLHWEVAKVNESFLNISINDINQTILFQPVDENLNGQDQITIWLVDMESQKDSQSIWVNLTPKNDEPNLKNMLVVPSSGSPSTEFNYSVQFSDIDGDLPDYIIVKIDNQTSFEMQETNKLDTDTTDGKFYYYKTKLSSVQHFYWFECHDGKGGYANTIKINGPLVTLPDKGSLYGRVVDSETKIPIRDANITITDTENSSTKFVVRTDEDGNYTVMNLLPGINRYKVYATANGYRDSKLYNRTIIKGVVSILNFELEKLPGEIVNTIITKVWIDANRTNITVHHAISFTGFAEDLDSDLLNYTWDVGDGSETKRGKVISHSFHKEGNFTVNLIVQDTDGNALGSFVNVTVNPGAGSNISDGDGGPDGKPDGSTDGTEEMLSENFSFIIILILLITIILIMVMFFIHIQRKNAHEAMLDRAEEENSREVIKERRRRRKELEFVDREKQNVEQINLAIAGLHKSRGRGKSKDKRNKGGRKLQQEKDYEVEFEEDDDVESGNEKSGKDRRRGGDPNKSKRTTRPPRSGKRRR